jgi:nucleoside-diphosphate-sugar epimerase
LPLQLLVTGANGFIGKALCPALAARGHIVRQAVRQLDTPSGSPILAVGSIDRDTDWSAALQGIDIVVHLAARAHVMSDTARDVLAAYRQVNVGGTESLARQSVQVMVKRFVLLSSVKVNGEVCEPPGFNERDEPAPEDAYGVSKLEAERRLREICSGTRTEFVILRAPLVYGAGVKGNLAKLMQAIERGMPLPLAAIDNRRSLVGLDNLVSAIAMCVDHPAAAGRTFLVCDDEPISSAGLARAIAAAMERAPKLLPVPVALLRCAGILTGRAAAVRRLVSSLAVDASAIRDTLGWRPPTPFSTGIRAMVRGRRAEKS